MILCDCEKESLILQTIYFNLFIVLNHILTNNKTNVVLFHLFFF